MAAPMVKEEESARENLIATFAPLAEEPFPSLIHLCKEEMRRRKRSIPSLTSLPSLETLRSRSEGSASEGDSDKARSRSKPLSPLKDRMSEKRIRERFYARMRRGESSSGSDAETSPQFGHDLRREKSYDEAALLRIKHQVLQQQDEEQGYTSAQGDNAAHPSRRRDSPGGQLRRELSFDDAAQARRRLEAQRQRELKDALATFASAESSSPQLHSSPKAIDHSLAEGSDNGEEEEEPTVLPHSPRDTDTRREDSPTETKAPKKRRRSKRSRSSSTHEDGGTSLASPSPERPVEEDSVVTDKEKERPQEEDTSGGRKTREGHSTSAE